VGKGIERRMERNHFKHFFSFCFETSAPWCKDRLRVLGYRSVQYWPSANLETLYQSNNDLALKRHSLLQYMGFNISSISKASTEALQYNDTTAIYTMRQGEASLSSPSRVRIEGIAAHPAEPAHHLRAININQTTDPHPAQPASSSS